MSDPFHTHGAFSWTELLTSDPSKAKSFYTSVFGWETEEMPTDQGPYTVFKISGTPIGGMMKTPAQAGNCPPNWGSYITVDNVDETASVAKQHGAKVIVPCTDIPGVGRFCTIQDPQGAFVSFITYSKESQAAA